MFLLQCPWCGSRDLVEFSCHGEAHIIRPAQPHEQSDQEWGDYVFFRTNHKGWQRERWVHDAGCRRWFYAIRNSATDAFAAFYKPGDPLPPLPLLPDETLVKQLKALP
ncbi:MAG: sarcosine oxidase subunit delta [Pseudomonadota bacterium]